MNMDSNRPPMKRTERAELAVKRHEAGEPVSAIARDLGISTAAVYRAIKRRQEWADAERAHAEKIRADAHNLSNEAQRADLAIRREAIEALPRGRALDGSAWVNLADVLRLLV